MIQVARKPDRKRSAKQASTIERLRLELHQVKEELRQRQIEGLVDLQIALNIKQENERGKITLEMADQRKYPHESLEYLRNACSRF